MSSVVGGAELGEKRSSDAPAAAVAVAKKDVKKDVKQTTDAAATTDEKKEAAAAAAPQVDKAVLKEQFEAFSKFGDKSADGKTIKLSQSDKWFKQAKVIDANRSKGRITTTDTGIAFRKISKNAPKLSFVDWNKYLDEIAKTKQLDGNEVKGKLVNCGKPGFTGATSVAKSAALDRLTDSARYGGTHKQRFDAGGKGRGKDGRADAKKNDGFVSGYKEKDKADDNMRNTKVT